MERDKTKRILIRIVPSLIFLLIFSFALACGTSPEETIERTKEEIGKEIEEEIIGVEEAKVTTENIKASGKQISLGEAVEYEGLKVSVTNCEFSDSYQSDWGTEYPKEGARYIWIYVKAENLSKQEKHLPYRDDFYLLYVDSLISEGWGMENPYPVSDIIKTYSSESVMPGISREGWILFEVPKDAKAGDILIALEYDYDKYYYWGVLEIEKMTQPEAESKEEEQEEKLREEVIINIGDTVEQVEGTNNLSITFQSWTESNIAVDGPYSGDTYYTFTAKPGMKFVIITYEFKNNGVREQETPYIMVGEVATDKGYFYSIWSPPLGVHSEEYNPRESTEEEIEKLIGNSGGYEKLLPEQSVRGCVVFEITEDLTPVEVDFSYYIPYFLKLTK